MAQRGMTLACLIQRDSIKQRTPELPSVHMFYQALPTVR